MSGTRNCSGVDSSEQCPRGSNVMVQSLGYIAIGRFGFYSPRSGTVERLSSLSPMLVLEPSTWFWIAVQSNSESR